MMNQHETFVRSIAITSAEDSSVWRLDHSLWGVEKREVATQFGTE